MTPPENNDLREANRALQSTVQDYKTKNYDMRRIIDGLTAQLAAQRPQGPLHRPGNTNIN